MWLHQDFGSTHQLLSHLRVFGCLAFAILPGITDIAGKQATKGERCIVLGISSDNHKNYELYSLDRGKFVVARSVVTNESQFPYRSKYFDHTPPEPEPGSADGDELAPELIGRGVVGIESKINPIDPSANTETAPQTRSPHEDENDALILMQGGTFGPAQGGTNSTNTHHSLKRVRTRYASQTHRPQIKLQREQL